MNQEDHEFVLNLLRVASGRLREYIKVVDDIGVALSVRAISPDQAVAEMHANGLANWIPGWSTEEVSMSEALDRNELISDKASA